MSGNAAPVTGGGRMPEDWAAVLSDVMGSSVMSELKGFLKKRISEGASIYPSPHEYFLPFRLTGFSEVKVVILGQDPYCAPGQAHGLGFSVPYGTRIPPALYNIHKELREDMKIMLPGHGCLDAWTREGVLLLNSTFTVERDTPGSHKGKGWEIFTAAVLAALARRSSACVFMAWGKEASGILGNLKLDTEKHIALYTSHPAPYSATKGFLGCRHFSKANFHLRQNGVSAVSWNLPEPITLTSQTT